MGCNTSKVVLTPEEIVTARRESRSISSPPKSLTTRLVSLFRGQDQSTSTSSRAGSIFRRKNNKVTPLTRKGGKEDSKKLFVRSQTMAAEDQINDQIVEDDLIIDDDISCDSLTSLYADDFRKSTPSSLGGPKRQRPMAAKGPRSRPMIMQDIDDVPLRHAVSTPEPRVSTPAIVSVFPSSSPMLGLQGQEEDNKRNYLDRRSRPKGARGERHPPDLHQQFEAELSLPGTVPPAQLNPKRRQELKCLDAWMERRIQDEGMRSA